MSCSHHHHRPPGVPPGAPPPFYPETTSSPGAKWIKGLTTSRLNTFTGGLYSSYNLSSVLFTHILDGEPNVVMKVWSPEGRSKPGFTDVFPDGSWDPSNDGEGDDGHGHVWKKAEKGISLGPSWTNHWWKVSLKIPSYWEQYERVQFEFDPGCEAMVFTTDGTPLQGITGGFGGDRRVEYIIPREDVLKGVHHIVIESSCNGMFGVPWNGDTVAPPDMNRYFSLASAQLVVPNMPAWHLMWDFNTLKELGSTLPGNTSLQNQAIVAANEIMNVFAQGHASADAIEKGRKVAENVFGKGWQAKGSGVYEEGEGVGDEEIWGIGHCHIDTAWLWPYSVTQQKVARSWSTQLDLFTRYPEHRFTASSAQQYAWLQSLYPPLFKQLSNEIKTHGRFTPIGGAWVEHDANMPSGEALVRQMLFGQRYFEAQGWGRCEVAWLPDTFGLTGSLPQLIRGAGMKYFFTQKLSWNNINTFPHSTFNWVGIDGSQVLCHMTPVDTYTAQASVGDVNKGLTNHKNLESSAQSLLVFGNGDGGGGPLAKMLENLRRIRATTNNHRELPRVSMGRSVDEFYVELLKKSNGGSKLPNWHGELYLEFHRGTYTSHGSIKKGNRHSEILLRDVELVCTLASIFASRHGADDVKKSYVYPKRKIEECWEKVLLNQFHDVLPGSAIGMVYDDAEKLYAEVKKDGTNLLNEALDILFPSSRSLLDTPAAQTNTTLLALNTTPFPRRSIVSVPISVAYATQNESTVRPLVAQVSPDGMSGYAVLECAKGERVMRGVRAASLSEGEGFMPAFALTNGSDHFVLKNGMVQLTLSKGRITSLVDTRIGRELIEPGQTGGLVIFDDKPVYWPAWDVEIYHLETAKQLAFENVSVVAQGPLRASVKATLKYGKSTIGVTISLDAITATTQKDSRPLFVFDADIDWRQRNEFLKFELPLTIRSPNATYEAQFGWVQRPTHKNTAWDQAKFEVCGHKYADLSEFGYGVAILSESKYGFSCLGSTLRISLLRAAEAPDAEQDQGRHTFSWAVMPHLGSFLESDVPQAAYLFNSPLHVRSITSADTSNIFAPPLRVVGSHNVFLETVKRGEDDDFSSSASEVKDKPTTVVLRLYEAFGGHGRVGIALAPSLNVVKAFETNLLEDHSKDLSLLSAKEAGFDAQSDTASASANAMVIPLSFRGFEVKTVKLILGGHGAGMQTAGAVTVQDGKRDSWVSVDETTL